VVPWTLARSRLARASRAGQPHEIVTQLCGGYTPARLARLIRVAAPELTAARRAELTEVLQGGDARAA
jgi:hypothetical protein